MTDIALSVTLSRTWLGLADLELNDHGAYTIAEGSFEDGSMTFRRSTATSPFIDGEYIFNAKKGNVTETLAVYVAGSTSLAKTLALDALKDALSQPTFTMVRTLENAVTTWSCYASDYTTSSTRPLTHAKMVLLKASVVANPAVPTVSV